METLRDKLMEMGSEERRRRIAQITDPYTLADLVKSDDRSVLVAAVLNEHTPNQVRSYLASLPELDEVCMAALAESPDFDVQRQLAAREGLPPHIANILRSNKNLDPTVKEALTERREDFSKSEAERKQPVHEADEVEESKTVGQKVARGLRATPGVAVRGAWTGAKWVGRGISNGTENTLQGFRNRQKERQTEYEKDKERTPTFGEAAIAAGREIVSNGLDTAEAIPKMLAKIEERDGIKLHQEQLRLQAHEEEVARQRARDQAAYEAYREKASSVLRDDADINREDMIWDESYDQDLDEPTQEGVVAVKDRPEPARDDDGLIDMDWDEMIEEKVREQPETDKAPEQGTRVAPEQEAAMERVRKAQAARNQARREEREANRDAELEDQTVERDDPEQGYDGLSR